MDRSRFKTKPEAYSAKEEQIESLKPKSGSKNFNYHSIESGDNRFRIFPPHPDGGGTTFWELKSVCFLRVEQPKRDNEGNEEKDKEGNAKKEIKNKPVFNGRVHGPFTDKEKKELRDPVELYLDRLNDLLHEEIEDEKERKDMWQKLTGFGGLRYNYSYVAYAYKLDKDDNKKFGLMEWKSSVHKQIKKVGLDNQEGDEPLTYDIYSDPDEGIVAKIKKEGQGKDTEYTVSLDQKRKGKIVELNIMPLEEEELDFLLEHDSLYDMFNGSYGQRDYDYQLEGLRRFDDEQELGIFEDEIFQKNLKSFADFLAKKLATTSSEKEKRESSGEKDVLPWDKKDEQVEEETPKKEVDPSYHDNKLPNDDEEEEEKPAKAAQSTKSRFAKKQQEVEDEQVEEEEKKPTKKLSALKEKMKNKK